MKNKRIAKILTTCLFISCILPTISANAETNYKDNIPSVGQTISSEKLKNVSKIKCFDKNL